MILASGQIIYSFAKAGRAGRCKLLKNYKKGKFAAIFVAVFPLYVAAYITKGQNLLRIIINSFNSTLRVVALSFDLDVLEPVAKSSNLFHAAIALCLILAVVNAFLLSTSLLFRRIFNARVLRRIKRGKRDVCILVGFNDKGRRILSSVNVKKRKLDVLVLSSSLTDGDKESIYVARGGFSSFGGDLYGALDKECGGFKNGFSKRHCAVILLSESEEENLKLAFSASKIAESLGEDLCLVSDRKVGLDTYLFSNNAGETVYRRIVRSSFGTVHCMNKYQMLACDFTQKYPLTEFIPHLIDKDHAALIEGSDVRTIMLGFGKMNRQLFRIYTQNNQCMVTEKGVPKYKPLKFYIFDKDKSYEESSFNHTYLHYERWKKEQTDKSDYFDLPPEPAEMEFKNKDINTGEFKTLFRESLTTSEKGHNNVIIAMGTDLEALELAEKVAVDVREIGAENNTVIFVRVRNSSLLKQIMKEKGGEIPIIPFGDELSLYSYDRIVNPSLEGMAKDRHLCYAIEEDSDKSDDELRREAFEKWLFRWENIQRESNVYAILSIRMKLQLLGYDCVPFGDPAPNAANSFLDAYEKGNKIVHKERTVNGKKLVDYKVPYRVEGSPRSVLAELEHSRWNAYHICNGFVPASKREYLEEDKNSLMRRRKHINITTFKGLDDFDRWRAKPNEELPDIIFYDYQLMDDAVWILGRNGYKIIKRK